MARLGDLVRDEVSGYEGIVLARMECMYEATSCRVHPRNLTDQGEVRVGTWFEEDRLILIKETEVVGFVSVEGRAESDAVKS